MACTKVRQHQRRGKTVKAHVRCGGGYEGISSNSFTKQSKTFDSFAKKFSKAKGGSERKKIVRSKIKSKTFLNAINKTKFKSLSGADMGKSILSDYGIKSHAIVIKNRDGSYSLKTSSLSSKF